MAHVQGVFGTLGNKEPTRRNLVGKDWLKLFGLWPLVSSTEIEFMYKATLWPHWLPRSLVMLPDFNAISVL